jgi:hypothetical protein
MHAPAGHILRPLLAAALWFAVLPATAHAATSFIIKINLNVAMNGNVTPGDLPGFPVTITKPGVFELDGNLDIRKLSNSANLSVIQVTADDVTIDLKGFQIIGPAQCTGRPLVCIAVGTGDGISSSKENIKVTNGTIRGMGDDGIALENHGIVENVRVLGNGGDGIAVDEGSRVEHCTASSNGDQGIQVGNASIVRDNTVSDNHQQGILANQGSLVTGNTVFRNDDDGVQLTGAATIRNNTIEGHTANFGLLTVAGVGYGDNVLRDNNGPIGNNNPQVSGPAVQIGTNLCGTDTVCP